MEKYLPSLMKVSWKIIHSVVAVAVLFWRLVDVTLICHSSVATQLCSFCFANPRVLVDQVAIGRVLSLASSTTRR